MALSCVLSAVASGCTGAASPAPAEPAPDAVDARPAMPEVAHPPNAAAAPEEPRPAPGPEHAEPRPPASANGSIRGRLESMPSLPDAEPPRVVVALPLEGTPRSAGRKLTWRRTDGAFAPGCLVAGAGLTVVVCNDDGICHQFFSSTAGNEFELPRLDPGETAFLRAQRPGLVRVYCALHAGEQATMLVVPSPHFAVVEPDGAFALEGLCPGDYELQELRGGRPAMRLRVAVPAGRETEIPATARWLRDR
jgi:hypothetical protein